MALPCTVPLMSRVTGGDVSLMLPLRTDPDCCQVSVKVPWKEPLYCPDHVPDSPPVAAAVDAVDALAAVGAVVGAGAAVVAVVAPGLVTAVVVVAAVALVEAFLPLLQPGAVTPSTATMAV